MNAFEQVRLTPVRPPCGDPNWRTFKLSETATKKGRQRARNRHAGRCTWCGRWVEAGAGALDKSGGRWVVFC